MDHLCYMYFCLVFFVMILCLAGKGFCAYWERADLLALVCDV